MIFFHLFAAETLDGSKNQTEASTLEKKSNYADTVCIAIIVILICIVFNIFLFFHKLSVVLNEVDTVMREVKNVLHSNSR